jgi:hypothetical protein
MSKKPASHAPRGRYFRVRPVPPNGIPAFV